MKTNGEFAKDNSEMEINRGREKYIGRVAWGYGLIVALVNFIGFLLASSGGIPLPHTEDYYGWLHFMDEYSGLTTTLSIVAFVTPAVIIFSYRLRGSEKRTRRIINLPFAYAAIGSLGWIMYFVMEYVCLVTAKNMYGISIGEIVSVSFLNIVQECICIFTLAFFIMDLLHRKVVLPKLFPEGHLDRYEVRVKPSVRFLVNMFYLSVCIFPVFFLVSSLVTFIRNNGMKVDTVVFTVLICVLIFTVIILWAFCDYISSPIKKLKLGTQRIKEGEYGYSVDIVSNDDFGELADAFNEMSGSLEEKNNRILAIQNSIIKGMAVMVESRDNSTGGHINRTSDCVRVFVDRLIEKGKYSEYTDEYWKAVIKAAPMHDLGKIAVKDAVLQKPGKFTDEEYEIMKTHSAEGARIVENVLSQVDDELFKRIAVNVAHYHHEKWNGAGYPEKISGEDIPFEARLMALADVFDALVSKRCYKDSFTYDKAFQIIEESLGTHFDPNLGKEFIECRPQLEALYARFS